MTENTWEYCFNPPERDGEYNCREKRSNCITGEYYAYYTATFYKGKWFNNSRQCYPLQWKEKENYPVDWSKAHEQT